MAVLTAKRSLYLAVCCVVLYSADEFYHGSMYEYFRVRVEHTGRVHWSFGGPLQLSCPLDTTLYPFDRQRCRLLLKNWAYSLAEVDLRNGSRDILDEGRQDSGTYIHTANSRACVLLGRGLQNKGEVTGVILLLCVIHFLLFLDRDVA